ncbi:hypothetical protein LTR62_004657 [Meristemomyces frigidus]|uniref:Uncharacterized protein n=1 Tax=Meristemomyces frigidus TaxID=1508187 RepID=A0AAN7YP21_9PEZI|nr:hypothetical protein LTR62_004657 [Meristemomyces frigidus]
MALLRLCNVFAAIALVAEARRHAYQAVGLERHQAMELERRQYGGPAGIMGPPPEVSVRSTSSASLPVITYITPSPGASPIAITQQSQIVTTYGPQFTLCELPPIAFYPTTLAPSARPSIAPYHNYSISFPPGSGTCSTIYSATETMVCDTTLSDLTTTYPVTNCAQDITFSSQYGYTLVTPHPTLTGNTTNTTLIYPTGTGSITPGPSIETKTTYFIAPWQSLTAATPPTNVIRAICSAVPAPPQNGTVDECITEYEIWHTSLVTKTTTITSSLNISTVIQGPSGVVIWETVVANVTEAETTFSMTTTTELTQETHFTTTQRVPVSLSTAPTVFETLTLELASSTAT